jgi:hypothetical protein
MQRSLVDPDAEGEQVVRFVDCAPNTDIVAFWDGSHRWIAYQNTESSVVVKGLDSNVGEITRTLHGRASLTPFT